MELPVIHGDLGNTCLDNLQVCKASCCRVLTFNLQVCVGHPLEHYYKTHGVKVQRLDRNTIKLIIPHVCEQLDQETYLCKLHGKPEKPLLCRGLTKESIQNGNYHKTDGCVL